MSIGTWADETGPRNYRFIFRTDPNQGQERLMGNIPSESDPNYFQRWVDNRAILGFQRELSMVWGYDIPITGLYDWNTRKAVVMFQRTVMSLGRRKADGIIGRVTAKELFSARVDAEQVQRRIDGQILCKLLDLEGGWDPGATGRITPQDRGLAQINANAHPDVTDEEAFQSAFAIEWTAKRLRGAFEEFNTTAMRADGWERWQIWDLALAYHNSPVLTRQWAEDGYENPPFWRNHSVTGEPLNLDYYVKAIRARECG